MGWLQKQIDRFCYKYPKFGIPNLMLYVAIGNVSIYLLDVLSKGSLSPMLCFSRSEILYGQIWRLITFVFVSASPIVSLLFPLRGFVHVAVMAYCFYLVGSLLERGWGTARFNLFYFTGVFFNIVLGLATDNVDLFFVNLTLFLAIGVLYPDLQVLLFFIIPLKAKWIAWIEVGWLLYWSASSLVQGVEPYRLLPAVAAIVNFLIFCYEDLVRIFHTRTQRFRHSHAQQTIHFQKAAQTIYDTRGYIHKCAVCGVTDADNPQKTFRYCSRCTGGSYCYCSEHIQNHTHIVSG